MRTTLPAQSTTQATPGDVAPPPTFSIATLRQVLAELEPLHGQRAVKAGYIVVARSITRTVSGNRAWFVQSESDPTHEYIVLNVIGDRWTCGCKDYERHAPAACKHQLAVKMLLECEARERGPEPPPIPLPFVELDPAAPIPFELTPLALAALDAPAAAVA